MAEVLQQAHHLNLRSSDWVGGDAWFSLVEVAIALKKQVVSSHADAETAREPLDVDLSFMIKNNLARCVEGWLSRANDWQSSCFPPCN